MEWVIGISTAIIAVSQVVLAVFLIRCLFLVNGLIRNANSLVGDVESKCHVFDSFFQKVASLTANSDDNSSEQNAKSKAEENYPQQGKLLGILEWTLVGITLWKKLKKGNKYAK